MPLTNMTIRTRGDLELTRHVAERAIYCDSDFAAQYPGRPHGQRNGCVFTYLDGFAVLTYWTKARAISVVYWYGK